MPKGSNNQDIANRLANSEEFITRLAYCVEYDSFYVWDGYYFKLTDRFELEKMVHLFIAREFDAKNITDSIVRDVIKSCKYYINLTFDTPDMSRVAFLDKTFNLNTFEWEEHSRSHLTVFNFPHNSQDIHMPTPNWDNFLKTSLVIRDTTLPDMDLIGFAQEMFGYFLLPSLKGSSAFFLVGGGSNGKSVMVKVLEEMFGKRYCSSMSIQKLTTNNWAPAHLIGKKINISNEEESKYMRADTLKALITGDTINAERKFGDPFEFTPHTKFIFATNDMPSFETMNYGLKRRLKFLPFYRRFADKDQDKGLQEKLSKEIPGIIGWAIDGAIRFTQNDHVFNVAQASNMFLDAFVAEISGAVTFFHEFYEIDTDSRTANSEVYVHYCNWCADNGRKPLNSNNFWKEINKEFDNQIRDIWLRNEENRPVKGKNIKLKNYDSPDFIAM